MTSLININDTPLNWKSNDKYVYIGRRNVHYGLPESKWCNPYVIEDGNIKRAIERYREYIESKPELLENIEELRGKILVCYCKPRACHGDVLLQLLGEIPTQMKMF